jgi:transposase
MQIDPEYALHLPNRHFKLVVATLDAYSVASQSELQQQRAAAVRRLGQRLRLALEQVKDLGRQIRARAKVNFSALTHLCGIDLLTAGAIAAALGPGRRFSTEAQVAAYAGVAPLEASSAGLVRHRLNRGDNRRLNKIWYAIALTQSARRDAKPFARSSGS